MTKKLASLINEIPTELNAARLEAHAAWADISSNTGFASWQDIGSLALLRRNDLGGLADRIAACR